MEWFDNQWIIGTGTGLISGIIIYISTKFILGKKNNQTYLQKIQTTSIELSYIFKDLIAQGNLPSQEMLDAIIRTTIRKHNVVEKDISNFDKIVSDLTHEVVLTPFLSNEQKEINFHQIQQLKKMMIPITADFKNSNVSENKSFIRSIPNSMSFTVTFCTAPL